MVKKISSVILIISITLNLIILPSGAAGYSTSQSFESYLKAHYKNFETDVDISYYVQNKGLTLQDAIDTHIDLVNNDADLFYVNVTASARSVAGVNFITGINYICTKSELPAKQKEMKAAADKALAVLNDSMTDAEKVMALHDYMVLNTNYDTITESKNNGYEALVNKSAICQGYARGFQYILSAAGFENVIIRAKNSKMNHGWNIVNIDEGWFHVDTTKDDPVSTKMDSYGRVSHKYSLSSDAYIESQGHIWEKDKYPSATNTKYDGALWRNARSPMIKYGDDWYYIDEKTAVLYKHDFETNGSTKLYTITRNWYVWGSKKLWGGSYSSLAHYNGLIYFNDANSIYKYDLKTNKTAKVLTLDKDAKGYIYGFNMDGNVITYTIKEKPVYKNTLKALSVSKATSTAIKLNKATVNGKAGKSYKVTASLTPSASKDYIYWTSSDTSVVTVENGKLTCKTKGTAVVTAYTSTGKKAKVTVKVS